MPSETSSDVKFEIGHVLFIDIVGYSKLLMHEQSEQLQKLKEIVRGTEQFRLAEAEGKLLRLPTGDGGALVFRNTLEAPVLCAIEISKALKNHAELRIRMGIHSGPVNEVADLNEQANIAGAGINIAQRVMDCGDAGHILLSKHVAEDLEHYARWRPYLHDLGECEVKHGRRLSLVNFYTDELGNPKVPPKLQSMPDHPGQTRINNLPAQLSSFIGREKEMTEIKQLLENTRLLTLTGAGGCGKTRLALQVVADLFSEYPAGVCLVELAPASDPDMVAQLAAKALRIREQPKRPLVETLADRLRAKRLLLLLDNCEHLLEACAELAHALLKTCRNLRILATSREAIGVAGERTWPVPSLATPEPSETMSVESLCQFEAIRLFGDRAVAVQPRFSLTPAIAPAVAQICWRLEGIPLAIELAAARIIALSAAQIAERLQDSLQLLSHGKRTALPRHQTLRATIDWSCALLTDAERSLFQRLSVFAGGFDLEAAENICAGGGIQRDEILDLLTQLVKKSLVLMSGNASATRYSLLQPIRVYAQDQLRHSGALTVLQQTHLGYFLHYAQDAASRMLGPTQQETSEELEAEHANLLTALAWATEHDSESALKLSNALGWFWEKRGYLAEGREWFKRTIMQTPPELAPLRGEAYVRAGRLACWQGDYKDAVTLTEQGLRLCEESGNRRWIGMALNNLGSVAAWRGELAQAVPLLDQSLSIAKQSEDSDLLWRSLGDLGVVAMLQGDYKGARDLFEQAVLIGRQRGDEDGGLCVRLLGDVERALGNFEKAIRYYEQTLSIGRKVAHKRAVVSALEGLGNVAFDQGNHTRARELYEEALQAADELGPKSEYATTLGIYLAELAAEEGKFDEARRLCLTSLRNSQEVDDKESIVAELNICAWLCLASGAQVEAAAELLGAVEAIQETLRIAMPPRQRARHERHIAVIRGALNQEVFAAAWARGKSMSIDEAVAFALKAFPPVKLPILR
jgi:predicted ATPase